MPPRRAPARASSRPDSLIVPPSRQEQTPEGHVQSLLVEEMLAPQAPSAVAVPVIPMPVSAVNQIIDLLVTRSGEIAQQELPLTRIEGQVAAVRATTAVSSKRHRSVSPQQTVASKRHRSPPRRSISHRSPPRRSGQGRGSGTLPTPPNPSRDYGHLSVPLLHAAAAKQGLLQGGQIGMCRSMISHLEVALEGFARALSYRRLLSATSRRYCRNPRLSTCMMEPAILMSMWTPLNLPWIIETPPTMYAATYFRFC